MRSTRDNSKTIYHKKNVEIENDFLSKTENELSISIDISLKKMYKWSIYIKDVQHH